jgi:hypothetical protein
MQAHSPLGEAMLWQNSVKVHTCAFLSNDYDSMCIVSTSYNLRIFRTGAHLSRKPTIITGASTKLIMVIVATVDSGPIWWRNRE